MKSAKTTNVDQEDTFIQQTPIKPQAKATFFDSTSHGNEPQKVLVDKSAQTIPEPPQARLKSPTFRDAQTEHHSPLSQKDNVQKEKHVWRQEEVLKPMIFSPSNSPSKLRQPNSGLVKAQTSEASIQTTPTRNDELIGAKDVLYQAKEEELQEKSNRIETLKDTNRRVAIRYLLSSFELMRLDSLPPPPPTKSITEVMPSANKPLNTKMIPATIIKGTVKIPIKTSSKNTQTSTVTVADSCEDHANVIAQLQRDKDELKDIIIKNMKNSSNIQQPKAQNSELIKLRKELSDVRKQLEDQEWEHENKPDFKSIREIDNLNEQIRQAHMENDRLISYWQRDKSVIREMNQELKQALAEIENQKSFSLTQRQIHEAEKAQLLSKLAKRDVVRKELESVINELERIKKESSNTENTKARTNEDLVLQNQSLKADFQEARNELDVLRKLMGRDGRRNRNTPLRSSTPPKRGVLASRDHRDRSGIFDPQDKASQSADIQTFLLGLEICRLNFAYTGCRCGQIDQNYSPAINQKDQIDESPFRATQDHTDYTAKKRLQPSPSVSRDADINNHTALIKERESLKALLADYQKRLLEARRNIDSLKAGQPQKENVPANQAQLQPEKEYITFEEGPLKADEIKTKRELELKKKIIAAERALLTEKPQPKVDQTSDQF